jgi:hypothetical protein
MPPSTIPPAAILDDLVYPRELIASSTWQGGGWLGVNYFESLSPGQRFTLNLPVRLGTEAVEYQFTFEVAAPSDHAALISRRTSAAHLLPPYTRGEHLPAAEELGARGINLPSGAELDRTQVACVVEALGEALDA